MFVLAMALAVVIAGVWLSQPSLFEDSSVDVGLVHAAPGVTNCSSCHAVAVTITDYTGCTQCHSLPSLPALVTPEADIAFDAHHDLIGDVRFTATVYCQNDECHDQTDTDARNVISPVITGSQAIGHGYCWGQCHDDVKVTVPTCLDCHFGETYGADGSHPSHTSVNFKNWSTAMACSECHDTTDYPTFTDGNNLTATNTCDSCHSPSGAYDGVTSTGSSIGAKNNWWTKIYDGSHLVKAGLERWCAGCHDSAVGGKRDIVGSGFYTTGHGKAGTPSEECSACHDTTQVDYPLKAAFTSSNFYSGSASTAMALCFTCHSYDRYVNSNGDDTFDERHEKHLGHDVSCYACHAVSHTKDQTNATVLANNMIKVGTGTPIFDWSGSFDGNGTCGANDMPGGDCHGGDDEDYTSN